MRLKVLKYDKQEAKGRFVLFKFLELLGLFLFTFGFENLGRFVYGKYGITFGLNIPVSYFDFWAYGLLIVVLFILIVGATVLATWGLALIIVGWFKLNWRWAKIASEDEDSKIERLSEQKKLSTIKEIEEQEEDRKKHGYCVGDKIKFKEARDYPHSCHAPNGAYGRKATLNKVCLSGDFRVKEFNEEGLCRKDEIERVIKKILIPKKPKLNKVREKEVNDRKKKK